MSYEGCEQFICHAGHFYEVDAEIIMHGVEDGVDWQKATSCPECQGHPVWQNSVNDTNCDAVGVIPREELEKWIVDPVKKIYRVPSDEETRDARHYWDGHRHVPLIVAEIMRR